MKERRLWIVLATLTVFAIAGGAQAQGASELRVGWLADPFNIELNRQRLAMYPLNANACEPLFRLTHDFRVAPWLGVRSVYVGNNTFRIRLRQGVRFHDGSPFTAETVKYSLDRTVRARIGYSFLAEGSTRVIDGETVEVRPTRPNLRLVEQLVHPTYAIVALNNDPRMHPVCTGLFRFREYIAQKECVPSLVDFGGAPLGTLRCPPVGLLSRGSPQGSPPGRVRCSAAAPVPPADAPRSRADRRPGIKACRLWGVYRGWYAQRGSLAMGSPVWA